MEFKPDMEHIKTLVLITSQQHFLIAHASQIIVRQSYPESYPFENNPKKDLKTNLVEICTDSIFGEKTTLSN